MSFISNKLSAHYQETLARAQFLADKNKESHITPQHIFLSLTQQKGSLAAEILNKIDLPSKQEEKNSGDSENLKNKEMIFSPAAKKIIEKSVLLAAQANHKYVGTEHLLLSILDSNLLEIDNIFKNSNIKKNDLVKHLKIVMKNTSRFPDISEALSLIQEMSANEKEKQTNKKNKNNILDYFGTELTNAKIQNNLDPVIGRDQEITRIIQILSRRTKNNPVLLGEPGVGKTAIIDGLAKKIVQGDVPDILIGKKIYSLDLPLLISGTVYRGEFEARLRQVIDEVKKSPEIILFIDEIHNIIGAGSVQGSMDAANILKPALARGEIRCIGATTFEDFKKHIEPDPALVRRFQPVLIKEPSTEESIQILKGLKKTYEKHHGVLISDEAIISAVLLSDRYLPEKFLPDKAIDLIDETAAKIKIRYKKNDHSREISSLKNKIAEKEENKIEAVRLERFSDALNLKEEINELLNEQRKLENKRTETATTWLGEVSEKDIKKIIEEMTNIPLDDLVDEERQRFLGLENKLSERIKGQGMAIKTISSFIKRARAGLSGRERPLGSFIFIGPSGVGKTETAKILAETVFGSARNLIRIDMSEFSEGFNVSRLIGSPAGYVGYKEGGRLTEAVRRQPYSVVLFDEIEKAHPEVYNLLLQVLENGHLTDATGRTVNFKNTLIILTSNLGQENFSEFKQLGFEENKKTINNRETHLIEAEKNIIKKVEQVLKPEFVNRLDKIIVFNPLTLNNIIEIVKIELEKLARSLNEQKIILKWAKEVETFLAKLAYKPNLGARAVRKTIQEIIEDPLADKILNRELLKNKIISLKLKNKKIIFN